MGYTVVLADDHALVRSGLRLLLAADEAFQVVGEASTRVELLELCRRARPDIVLLDVRLDDGPSLDLIPRIKETSPSTRILVVTMYDDAEYLHQALAFGGDGYLLKKAADIELLTALRAVAAGKTYIDPSLARSLVEQALGRTAGPRVRKEEAGVPLSEREKDVLRLLARGYSNQEIADQLCISVKTVETHKAHIREKLQLKRRSDLVRYAHEHNLL